MLKGVDDEKIKKILRYWIYLEKLNQGKVSKKFKSINETVEEVLEKMEKNDSEKEKKNRNSNYYKNTAIDITGTINLKEIDGLLENISDYQNKFNLDSCSNIIITVGTFYEEEILSDLYERYKLDDVEKGVNRIDCEYALFSVNVNISGEYISNSLQISPIFKLIRDSENINETALNRCLKENLSYSDIKNIFDKLKTDNIKINEKCIVHFKLYDSSKSNNKTKNNILYDNFFTNDFYSNDIEMVLNNFDKLDFEKKYIGALLDDNISADNLKDVFDYDVLCDILSVKNIPLGRWPSKYNQSLLQQIAINIATSNNYRNDFNKNGILAVDGPPGTGKTTMVKDVIANLLVSKAFLISEYDVPDQAFIKNNNYFELEKKEINDFSVLIASSNNDAIENIMKELPLISSVLINDDSFEELNNIINENSYYNKIIRSIDENNWSNICGILGNKGNRKNFCRKIDKLLKTVDDIKAKDRDGLLLEYRNTKKLFLQYYNEMVQRRDECIKVEEYYRIEKELETLKNEYIKYNTFNGNIFEGNIVDYENERQKIRKLKRRESFQNIFKNKNKRDKFYKYQYKKIEEIIKKNKELIQLDYNEKMMDLYNTISTANNIVKMLENSEVEDNAKIAHLCNPYNNEYDNRLREKLFVISVKMLFLFAVNSDKACENLKSMGEYIKNIYKDNSQDVFALYETTFLFFPIMSSAFASVSTMFKNIKTKNAFGYLIIDEAGQSEPQQAIGLLYRCKKAIIIGDPKQLTPIVGDGVINIIKKMVSKDPSNCLNKYIDVNNSVQLFADKINLYGINAQNNWQPLPLLVHRRCINPMFKISNELSYNNQMLHETCDPKDDLISKLMFSEKSIWYNINGTNKGEYKYYNEAQGEKVASLLKQYYEKHKQLPNMFVITPFREIKIEIKRHIVNFFNENCVDYDEKELKKWLENNISTIHSFQGKEANEVILILGGSLSLKGGNVINNFVSSNLINVAVTRAKYRLCVIGDIRIWEDNYNVFKIYENLISENLEKMLTINKESDSDRGKINELMPDKNYYIIEDGLEEKIIYLDAINKIVEKFLKDYEIKEDNQLIKILNNLPVKFPYLDEKTLAPAKYMISLIELNFIEKDWDLSFAGAQLTKIIEKITNQEIVIKLIANKDILKQTNNEGIQQLTTLIKENKDYELGPQIKFIAKLNEADICKEFTTETLNDFIKTLNDFKNIRNNVCHKTLFDFNQYNELKKLGYVNSNCIINNINNIFKF